MSTLKFKLIIRYETQFLIILVFIFEHIPIVKQLQHFNSCRVFGTYPGSETITRIYINVNFNPIPAEVLENQDMLGGGQFDPPL